MGTIQVREMTGGLDVRRLPETTPGGVLVRADDGHITRGGEFETRAAFVKEFTLPAGTAGLAHTRTGLMTFGSGPAPAGMPADVRYMQLVSGANTLVDIRDWELFEDKLYVVAEYDDGSVIHFYDGIVVTAWQEARARATISIDSGSITPAAQATATVEILGGTNEVINYIDSLTVSGTQLLDARIVHTGDNATTAALIAAVINDRPTTPKYSATVSGAVISLIADRAGAQANGRTIAWETNGNFSIGNATVFTGGADEIVPAITDVTVGGVSIIRDPVIWNGLEGTAQALADAIMDAASTPEYEATSITDGADNIVNVRTTAEGVAANGRAIVVTTSGTIAVSFPGGAALAGGADLGEDKYLPADLILTVREKMYAGAGSILHYSAIQGPTYWTPEGTAVGQIGAGFTNVAASNSSSYRITGLSRYHEKLAVFTPDTVQTWFLDPDPDLFVQTQVLENTGTECPRSVTQFGDSDIFYLDTSGLRSLRARDSSNAAASTDVGVPIDDLLVERLRGMTYAEKTKVVGLINPADKRFWLILGDECFVYSYYPNSKVNAWTRYEMTTREGDDVEAFRVDTALVYDRRVYLRADDGSVYCYGGRGKTLTYDDTQAVAWIPMLDANAPTSKKTWTAVDAALSGAWSIYAALDPLRPDINDMVANLTATSYGLNSIPMRGASSHIGMRFVSRGGHAILSALVIHFDGKVSED